MSSIGDGAHDVDAKPHVDALNSSGSEYEDDGVNEKAPDQYREASSGDEDEVREGRFYGPDSSWRFYTKEERAIAASLDQAENDDLSAHLYNAHAWKRQLYGGDLVSESQSWLTKRRWIKLQDNGKLPFLPQSAWTAWPLKPIDVPRSGEHWGIPVVHSDADDGTFQKREPWKPSLNLQDELKASLLRQAKDRFNERNWDQKGHGHSKKFSNTNSQASASSDAESDKIDAMDDLQKIEDQLEQENDEKPVFPMSITEEYTPVVLADEDLAESIAQPSVRHIISKLDDLLIGLHRSRLGHRQERSRSRGRSTGSESRSKSRSRRGSTMSVPAKRKRAASDLLMLDVDSNSDSDGQESLTSSCAAGRAPRRTDHRQDPGPRDWSEVLGVAALVGWDPEVLDRAARRCAAAFGEGMTMRIMPETDAAHHQDRAVNYIPDMISSLEPEPESGTHASDEAEDEVDFACPDKTCPRHKEPYQTLHRLREHLKRKHELSREDIDRLAPLVKAPEPGSIRPSIDDEAPIKIEKDAGYPCPDESCPRHTVPYSKRARLREHLRRKHKLSGEEADHMLPQLKRQSSASMGIDGSSSEEENAQDEREQSTDWQEGKAVRRDGFLEPINIRIGRSKDKNHHGRPKKRSASQLSRERMAPRGRDGRFKAATRGESPGEE